jgi:hypothetical protein
MDSFGVLRLFCVDSLMKLIDRLHGAGGFLGGIMEIPNAVNDNEPLGPIYKFEEAAEKLRVSKRRMQEIVKLHPHYAKNGRVYLFSENDIRLIWEGIHCHSSSSNAKAPITGTSVAPSASSLYSKARALTTRKPRRQSVPIVKLAS